MDICGNPLRTQVRSQCVTPRCADDIEVGDEILACGGRAEQRQLPKSLVVASRDVPALQVLPVQCRKLVAQYSRLYFVQPTVAAALARNLVLAGPTVLAQGAQPRRELVVA